MLAEKDTDTKIDSKGDRAFPRPATRNRLLAEMSTRDWALVSPHLETVHLAQHCIIETPQRAQRDICFIETGLVSMEAANRDGQRVEVGLIGNEGATGLSLAMGDDHPQCRGCVQVSGHGWRLPAREFKRALTESASLHRLLLKFVQAFMVQMSHTALANSRAKIEARLARWILMAHDRIDGDSIPITHQSLAEALGSRRAGITIALSSFMDRGLISASRGRLTLVDRDAMKAIAGNFYGPPEAEFDRLFGV